MIASPLHASGAEQFLKRLTVRNSLDWSTVPQPAFYSQTWPDDKGATTQIGVGVAYDLAWAGISEHVTLGPSVEYCRNTAIDKEQDALKVGLKFDWTPLDYVNVGWSPVIHGRLSYSRDGTQDRSGIKSALYLTAVFKGKGKEPLYFWLPNATSDFEVFEFRYEPHVGFEHTAVTVAQSSEEERSAARLVLRARSVLFILPKCTDHRVAASFEYSHRSDLLDFPYERGHGYDLIRAGIDILLYRFDSKNGNAGVGIGFEYVDGEDPFAGQQDQRYARASLTIQV